MNEKIPHNPDNWYTYIKEVIKRNPNGLEENILLPDLDNNGKVGK